VLSRRVEARRPAFPAVLPRHRRAGKKLRWSIAIMEITTFPMIRVIAVSEFVKQDLIKRGVSADRIVVRYLAADEKRFRPDPEARQHWAARYSIQSRELLTVYKKRDHHLVRS
jgi:hypothetical protein